MHNFIGFYFGSNFCKLERVQDPFYCMLLSGKHVKVMDNWKVCDKISNMHSTWLMLWEKPCNFLSINVSFLLTLHDSISETWQLKTLKRIYKICSKPNKTTWASTNRKKKLENCYPDANLTIYLTSAVLSWLRSCFVCTIVRKRVYASCLNISWYIHHS